MLCPYLPLDATRVRAFLLDIEGTTTSINFVYEVLFPYARNHVKEFVQRHRTEGVRADIAQLRQEHVADMQQNLGPSSWRDDSADAQVESVVAYVHWLMDRDRKSTALKSLQGKIWEVGYRTGELRSHVFADVPPALARWSRQKKGICIFSSGSILAQKLLFANTTARDLTRFITGFFDTATGAKTEAESFRRIAAALDLPLPEIVFLSDVVAELDAAQRANMQTVLCVRPGNPPQPVTQAHAVIHSFDEISFQ